MRILPDTVSVLRELGHDANPVANVLPTTARQSAYQASRQS